MTSKVAVVGDENEFLREEFARVSNLNVTLNKRMLFYQEKIKLY